MSSSCLCHREIIHDYTVFASVIHVFGLPEMDTNYQGTNNKTLCVGE